LSDLLDLRVLIRVGVRCVCCCCQSHPPDPPMGFRTLRHHDSLISLVFRPGLLVFRPEGGCAVWIQADLAGRPSLLGPFVRRIPTLPQSEDRVSIRGLMACKRSLRAGSSFRIHRSRVPAARPAPRAPCFAGTASTASNSVCCSTEVEAADSLPSTAKMHGLVRHAVGPVCCFLGRARLCCCPFPPRSPLDRCRWRANSLPAW
jgi:hypothetical protein